MSSTDNTIVENDSELTQPAPDPASPPLQVANSDSTLPTHYIPPPHAHTLPSAYDPDPYNGDNNNRSTIASRARATLPTRLTEQTWFLHVERYASVIGIVIAAVALCVTVLGIIVGVVVAVLVK